VRDIFCSLVKSNVVDDMNEKRVLAGFPPVDFTSQIVAPNKTRRPGSWESSS
jgi:hypothetical protein